MSAFPSQYVDEFQHTTKRIMSAFIILLGPSNPLRIKLKKVTLLKKLGQMCLLQDSQGTIHYAPLKREKLTLWILRALIFPVCLTWGPRHKSIKGPHLKCRMFLSVEFFFFLMLNMFSCVQVQVRNTLIKQPKPRMGQSISQYQYTDNTCQQDPFFPCYLVFQLDFLILQKMQNITRILL